MTPTEKAHEYLADVIELCEVASNKLKNGDGDEFFDCLGTMKNKLHILQAMYRNEEL